MQENFLLTWHDNTSHNIKLIASRYQSFPVTVFLKSWTNSLWQLLCMQRRLCGAEMTSSNAQIFQVNLNLKVMACIQYTFFLSFFLSFFTAPKKICTNCLVLGETTFVSSFLIIRHYLDKACWVYVDINSRKVFLRMIFKTMKCLFNG